MWPSHPSMKDFIYSAQSSFLFHMTYEGHIPLSVYLKGCVHHRCCLLTFLHSCQLFIFSLQLNQQSRKTKSTLIYGPTAYRQRFPKQEDSSLTHLPVKFLFSYCIFPPLFVAIEKCQNSCFLLYIVIPFLCFSSWWSQKNNFHKVHIHQETSCF